MTRADVLAAEGHCRRRETPALKRQQTRRHSARDQKAPRTKRCGPSAKDWSRALGRRLRASGACNWTGFAVTGQKPAGALRLQWRKQRGGRGNPTSRSRISSAGRCANQKNASGNENRRGGCSTRNRQRVAEMAGRRNGLCWTRTPRGEDTQQELTTSGTRHGRVLRRPAECRGSAGFAASGRRPRSGSATVEPGPGVAGWMRWREALGFRR